GSNPLLFADTIKRSDVCTDRECFNAKVGALVEIQIKQSEAAGEKPVKVSDSYPYYGHHAQPDVLYPSDYHEAQGAGECPATTAAVVVEGKQAGRKLYVCTNKKCPDSRGPLPRPQPAGKGGAQEAGPGSPRPTGVPEAAARRSLEARAR